MDRTPTPPADGRPELIADLVSAAAARTPDHLAIIDVTSGNRITWAALDAAVDAEALRLRAAGALPGERVVVRLRGGAGFCISVLGALRAGAIAVPVGAVAVRRELDIVFGDCRPKVVVTAEGDDAAVGSAAAVGAAVLGPPAAGAPSGPLAEPNDNAVIRTAGDPEDVALLIYTSGTTGTPRGVCLSHRAVLANRAQAAALRPSPVTPVDRVLLTMPLFHVLGFAAGVLQVCWSGATVVLADNPDAETVLDVLVAERISALAGVPSMYRALLDLPGERLRSATAGLRVCTSGGAPLPPEWLTAFHEATGLWIVEAYGLTEAGPVVTSNAFDRPPKPGSVGRVLPGIELRLVDAEGRPLESIAPAQDAGVDWDEWADDPADDTGRVALRGPNLFSGYWPDRTGGPDADGWFRTADVGFLDADGDLHLVDRASDVVIVSGFNVFPREVEQVLAELDGVAEAAVVGAPDERLGEVVKAVVVRKPDAELTEASVRAHCATRLARFKVPAVIEFAEALPRTPTGKVARRVLAGGNR
ncbi:AMP-binding protein [Pseudonocardia thermophila]|uniref:AMP-binding protein n=1 Tax=Pseudonocardia thermophila TaxID=1848 RepID=UPI001F20A0AB|nr:AMP-binding protein [Pseudonocardia thermophila]